MIRIFQPRPLLGILATAVFIFLPLLILATKPAVSAAPLENSANPGVTNQQTSADSLSFTLVTEANYLTQVNQETAGFNAITHEPGVPELPYYTTYIALPPEAAVEISVTPRQEQITANIDISPVAQPQLAYIDPSYEDILAEMAIPSPDPLAGQRQPDPAIYNQDSLYPTARYQLSDPVYLRDMRLVRLDLFPLQYNPLRREQRHAPQLDVAIRFVGGNLANRHPAPSANDAYQQTAAALVLNFEQGLAWRSLPPVNKEMGETAVSIPLNRTSYKIELNQDGIYEISGADLAAAGMDIAHTNPATLQMMSHGEPVAYQLVHNNDNILDPSDLIRFYGEAVHASRYEKQFLANNVYWLWPNGDAPLHISTTPNNPGVQTATTFPEAITREDENGYTATFTNGWPTFPNEPDSWYWQLLYRTGAQPLKRLPDEALTLTLPDPALASGATVTYTVEMIPYDDGTGPFTVTACLNAYPTCGVKTWVGIRNINITNTTPITALLNGVNTLAVDLASPVGQIGLVRTGVNRITVEYLRHLKAVNDQLIFPDNVGGRGMIVSDFSENDPADLFAWDISNPRQPVALTGLDISGSAPYTLTLGRASAMPQQYIATTSANLLTNANGLSLTAYTPPANLEPAGGADWVAITHADFLTQANSLAAHRGSAQNGGLKTHVVDFDDIVNVYNYGLRMPEAIHAYLQNALYTWPIPPGYAVLFGDGTLNPRNLDCSTVAASNGLKFCTRWDVNTQNFIPPDLLFTDRFQGLIPSDYPAVLLSGDDMLPDMAVGRIPVNTTSEAENVINKIIWYEQNQLNLTPTGAWQKSTLFMADRTGAGGPYCATNQNIIGPLLPTSFNQTHLCLDDYDLPDSESPEGDMRGDMGEALLDGISLINYRGHGSVQFWGGYGGADMILDASQPDEDLRQFWQNNTKPAVIISADCLDGHFAHTNRTALSERYLRLGELKATAAHWSSSGLGFESEHTPLVSGFYTGLFGQGHTAIGDAINYAKVYYTTTNYHQDELYAFNLQGDPAMQLFRPEINLTMQADTSETVVGDEVAFTLQANNRAIYPGLATITTTLSSGLTYLSATGADADITVQGNQVVIQLSEPIQQGETAVITLHTVANGQTVGTAAAASLTTTGLDINPANQSASANVAIKTGVYLPMIIK